MEFEWDQAQRAKTLRERGIGFDECAVENVAIGLACCPVAILAVIAPGIFPDQKWLPENSRSITA